MSRHFRNILIIKPSALGDITMALPALSSLRAGFPSARICWLVRPEFAPLLVGNPAINELIIFDRRFLGRWWHSPKAFTALAALIATLRRQKFDLVIDLQGLFRTAFLGALTGCKQRFGMAASREFAGLFYNHRIRLDADSIHVVDYYNKIVAATGASQVTTDFNLRPTEKALLRTKKLLTEHNIDADRYAVFVTGSSHTKKCWPIERFARLAEKVASHFGLAIVAVGSADEKPTVQQLQACSGVPVSNFAGLTDIPELVALLNGAKLVVSNDTGPGHIAAAMGMPLVIIFGPVNPARIMPYKRPDTVAAVQPNSRGSAIKSRRPEYKIQAVTVEQVFEKVKLQLEK